MYGQIQEVWPVGINQRTGKNSPGTVKFTDGTKFSTFDKNVLTIAEQLKGQMVEYTTSQNGQYTNLASLKPVSGPVNAPPQQPAYAPAPAPYVAPNGGGTSDVAAIAIRELSAAVRELTSAIQRSTAGFAVVGGGNGASAPVESPVVVDPVQNAIAKLGQALGSVETAQSFIVQLGKKHGEGTPAFFEALQKLIEVHA